MHHITLHTTSYHMKITTHTVTQHISTHTITHHMTLHDMVLQGVETDEVQATMAKAQSLTSKLMKQRSDHETLKRRLSQLNDALTAEKAKHVADLKERESSELERLTRVREEYEETIKRHLSFIDQLIADKTAVNGKCEDLLQQLKTVHGKYTAKLKAFEEAAILNIRQQKEVGGWHVC